jgi:1,4-dihydroxy-2-naphthoate polyprenyltransferase
VTDTAVRSRLSAWHYALRTTNPPEGPIDAVTRWIVVTRAAVLPMTLAALAFVHLRVAGPLLVLGLAVAAIAGM